jgi:peroxiredoxin Q/BCP
VSVDTVDSHRQFSEKFKFNFRLLSDPDEKVCAAYGVNVKDGQYPERVTFVVDGTGTIRKVFPKVSPKEHAREVLGALDS